MAVMGLGIIVLILFMAATASLSILKTPFGLLGGLFQDL